MGVTQSQKPNHTWVGKDVRRSLAQPLARSGMPRHLIYAMLKWEGPQGTNSSFASTTDTTNLQEKPELWLTAKRLPCQPCLARLRNRFASQQILFIPPEHSPLNDIFICRAL